MLPLFCGVVKTITEFSCFLLYNGVSEHVQDIIEHCHIPHEESFETKISTGFVQVLESYGN